MSQQTNIEWCDSTFNPWMGCTKVSPACDHCYAENLMDNRMHAVQWGAGQPRKRTSIKNWNEPLRWEKEQLQFFAEHGRRRRVFCASLADVFDNEVDAQWRADLFNLIESTPNLDWLLLTKRIGNVFKMVKPFPALPKNVWLGATICNQEEADRDIPKLIAINAPVHFLSIEPLLGPIDLSAGYIPCPNSVNTIMDPETGAHECCRQCDYTGLTGEFGIDWVIVGGESGPEARPMSPDWVRNLRDQCSAVGVPFLFKQWGEWLPMLGQMEGVPVRGKTTTADGWVMGHAGKKAAGRLLDGETHTEFPKVGV